MRILLVLLVSAISATACTREVSLLATPQVAQTIDLDTPGATDVLRVRYPTHYLALSDLLRNAHLLHCEEGKVQAREVVVEISPRDCGGFLLASFPPKGWARLEFRIDGTRYSKTVYLTMH